MSIKINADDIAPIALGGAFLATGGGGDTLLGEILAEDAVSKAQSVELIALEDVPDDGVVVAIGGVGSPTIMQEKPSNGQEAGWALDALETFLGKKITALIAFEAGGMNALVPFCAAAERGLPVVDADGMGRAFPELQMESFSIYGVSATPLALSAELGDSMILDKVSSPVLAETLVRHFAVKAGGGQCISAEHVMDGATARKVCIPATISLCRDIGVMLGEHANDLDAFMRALSVRLAPTHYGDVSPIAEAKVVDITREIRDGYDYGTAKLATLDGENRILTVFIKNEYLVVLDGDRPIATTPDLICMLDKETGRPLTAETLRYGQRLLLLAIGAPELMRTPTALKVVSPRNFGFDMEYLPIETALASGLLPGISNG